MEIRTVLDELLDGEFAASGADGALGGSDPPRLRAVNSELRACLSRGRRTTFQARPGRSSSRFSRRPERH